MGSRGAFINVHEKNFNFVENGQLYITVGEIDDIKIIKKKTDKGVKAPEYSHTENRIYAIIQKGSLKHLTFYDENHNQIRSIDFFHTHGDNKVKPHVHFDLVHNKKEPGTYPSKEDLAIADKIKRYLGVK